MLEGCNSTATSRRVIAVRSEVTIVKVGLLQGHTHILHTHHVPCERMATLWFCAWPPTHSRLERGEIRSRSNYGGLLSPPGSRVEYDRSSHVRSSDHAALTTQQHRTAARATRLYAQEEEEEEEEGRQIRYSRYQARCHRLHLCMTSFLAEGGSLCIVRQNHFNASRGPLGLGKQCPWQG